MSKIIKKQQDDNAEIQSFDFGHYAPGAGDEIRPFFESVDIQGQGHGSMSPSMEPPRMDQEAVLQEIQRKAYEEGFTHGERNGIRMGEEKLKAIFDRFEDLFRELAGHKETIFREAEQDIIHLSLEIAKKIVRKSVTMDEDIIRSIVQITLSKVARRSRVTIILNPVDYETLTHSGELLDKYRADFETMEIKSNDNIEPGGCLVETNSGIIDARIASQFREVENELLDLIPRLEQ